MTARQSNHRSMGPRQRGMVLVTALLLLLVVTILAVSMFRSFGVDEKIAGNTRDKQLAVEAAQSAELYAENWLMSNAPAAGPLAGTNCGTSVVSASVGQVCSAPLANPSNLPWPAGINYTPPNQGIIGATAIENPGAQFPNVYIQYLGQSGLGYMYLIDTIEFGANPNTVAQIEVYFQMTTINGAAG